MICVAVRANERLLLRPLSQEPFIVGSEPLCDLVVDTPTVSGRHVQLSCRGDGQVEIRDLGSLNGTFVAGSRISRLCAGVPVQVHLGAAFVLEILDVDQSDVGIEVIGAPADTTEASERAAATTLDGGWTSGSVVGSDLAAAVLGALASGGSSRGRAEALVTCLSARLGARAASIEGADDRVVLARFGSPAALDEARLGGEPELGVFLRSDQGGTHWTMRVLGADGLYRLDVEGEGAPPQADVPATLEAALVLLGPGAGRDAPPRQDMSPRHDTGFRLSVLGAPHVDPPSTAHLAVRRRLASAVRSSLPVMLLGETGTGKGVHARALHACSSRSGGPFRAVNACALPESLVESLLFGAEAGVATGVKASSGLFREAAGGTLFLDEIAEMAPALQAKLLRVLDDGEILPLGAGRPVQVDVRIVAATNVDPETAIREGRLRQDLYYRLRGCVVTLPPLAGRPEDIAVLAQAVLDDEARASGQSVGGFTDAALSALQAQAWPGNVRELEMCVRSALHRSAPGEPIRALALDLPDPPASPVAASGGHVARVEALERRLVTEALDAEGGSVRAAAERLGLSRGKLRRLLERLGLDRD